MNAAEKARLAKEKEEQAKLQRLEEEKKLKAEKAEKRKKAWSDFYYTGFGWILFVLTCIMLLVSFVGFLLGVAGGYGSNIGLWWTLLLIDIVIIVLAIIQGYSNNVILMHDVAGVVIFAFNCMTTFLFFIGLIGSIFG